MKLFQSKSSKKEDTSDETKKCGECLADIPKEAKKCSHCGSKQKQQYSVKHLVYALILIVFVVVVFSGVGDSPAAPTEPLGPTESQTYITAKGYVENVLKAPSTADFPVMGTVQKLEGEDRYVVYGYVDSENSFGAMIRSDWEVHLKYLGGDWVKNSSWELEYIDVE